MADNRVYPLTVETISTLLEKVGFVYYEEFDDRVMLDIKGNNVLLRVIVFVGKSQLKDETPWYMRFVTYSPEFEPRKAGIRMSKILEWLNERNADVIFGRYYYEPKTDTVVFEVSIPCNGGIRGEDFVDLLRISTISVDQAHNGLLQLAAD